MRTKNPAVSAGLYLVFRKYFPLYSFLSFMQLGSKVFFLFELLLSRVVISLFSVCKRDGVTDKALIFQRKRSDQDAVNTITSWCRH